MSKKVYLFILFALFSFSFCKEVKREKSPEVLTYNLSEPIPIPEPSGLDLSFNENGFWVVSDQNSKVYLIDSWGKEIKSFEVNGEDLEGITVVNDSMLAIVLERTREVVILDTSGNEMKRATLNLEGGLNSGLEGITYNPERKIFYILNEKNPGLLLTLDENLIELKRDTIKFAKDFSGIFFDDKDNTLWILSDENQGIYKTDLAGKVIREFKIKVKQPEGIALNKDRTKLFLVSDVTGNLYVFDLEQ
jgi:uncharacterized protein YjiK